MKILKQTEEAKEISESAWSSDIFYHHDFSTYLLDFYDLWRVDGDGNWLFRALWINPSGDDSKHLTIRQTVWDYLIQFKVRFQEFMEPEVEIIDYISNMLLDGQWGGYAELITFSEVNNIKISIFDSIASEQSITWATTTSRENSIFLLFSGDHYGSLKS